VAWVVELTADRGHANSRLCKQQTVGSGDGPDPGTPTLAFTFTVPQAPV
jgi:hypothetical protein